MTAENSHIFNFTWKFFYFLAILLHDGLEDFIFLGGYSEITDNKNDCHSCDIPPAKRISQFPGI